MITPITPTLTNQFIFYIRYHPPGVKYPKSTQLPFDVPQSELYQFCQNQRVISIHKLEVSYRPIPNTAFYAPTTHSKIDVTSDYKALLKRDGGEFTRVTCRGDCTFFDTNNEGLAKYNELIKIHGVDEVTML